MTSRNEILAKIRANKPAFEVSAPTLVNHDEDYPSDVAGLQARFAQALETMGGVWAQPRAGEEIKQTMRRFLAGKLSKDSLIASNVSEINGKRSVGSYDTPTSLHDIDIAVLRARFGIAETGSVCFTEQELTVNAIAYLAQHLVVLLDPLTIETNVMRAYRRQDYQNARYTVFHSGPSATADIEGVLVRGAQGVRSLMVIPV